MRCGTSMMMDALRAGGLEPAFESKRDQMNARFGDDKGYKPNPNGFYELNRKEYLQPDFPKMYRGKLVKILYGGLQRLPVFQYGVVFMRRNGEEVRQSYEAFFEIKLEDAFKKFLQNDFDKTMDEHVARLQNRIDTQVTVLWYRDVVKNSRAAFERLAVQGWPIDPEAAASVVDPSLCRFKLEELTVGI